MAQRFCYVVMAHTDTPVVVRLVRRILTLSPRASVVVRTALGDDLDPEAIELSGAGVLRGTHRNIWGDWTLARAYLETLFFARDTTDADWFVLVSGQDYPIRDLVRWEGQVRDLDAEAVIDVYPPMPEDWTFTWRMVSPGVGPRQLRRAVAAGWRRFQPLVKRWLLLYQGRNDPRWYLGVRRRRPLPIPAVKAGSLSTFSAAAVDSLRRTHEHDEAVREAFRTVRIPDESYPAAILTADPAIRIVDCATTYSYFDDDVWSPDWLDDAHLDRAARSPCAFARKLPPGAGPDLLAHVDALAARPEAEVVPVHAFAPDEPRWAGSPAEDPRVVRRPRGPDQPPASS